MVDLRCVLQKPMQIVFMKLVWSLNDGPNVHSLTLHGLVYVKKS